MNTHTAGPSVSDVPLFLVPWALFSGSTQSLSVRFLFLSFFHFFPLVLGSRMKQFFLTFSDRLIMPFVHLFCCFENLKNPGEGISVIPIIKHCIYQRPDLNILMTTSIVSALQEIIFLLVKIREKKLHGLLKGLYPNLL